MKIKTKTGERITFKEFFDRWKKGVENITPYQQLKINQIGYFTVFFGLIWGIIFSYKLKQWWLFVVLIGSSIVSFTSFLSNWQKLQFYRTLENEKQKSSN